jgi:serine/threonine-protein kinase
MSQRERLGKYELIEVLGKGAMGVVFKGFDPGIDRTVAIKTVRKELIEDDGRAGMALARFRNEARAAGRLSHPGIVAVYDYGESAELTYIAMEFVQGSSLREYFNRGTRFSEPDVVSIMSQLLEALQHAHGAGVWHRDIKPANLIIMSNGRLKVADFGIARIEASQLTQTGMVLGSPGYMAPEQYAGGAIDWRADLFAAGVVMHQLLTGERPFTGTTEQLAYKICHTDPPLPSAAAAGRGWERYDPIVARALAKKPQERYQSAAEFRDAILAAYAAPANPAVSEETIIVEAGAGAGLFEPSHPSARTGERSPFPGIPTSGGAPAPRPVESGTAERRGSAVSWPIIAGIAGAVAIGGLLGGWLASRGPEAGALPAPRSEPLAAAPAAKPPAGEPRTPRAAEPAPKPAPEPVPAAKPPQRTTGQVPRSTPQEPQPRPQRAERPAAENPRAKASQVAVASAPAPRQVSGPSLPGAPVPASRSSPAAAVAAAPLAPAPTSARAPTPSPEPVAAAEAKPPPPEPSIWRDQGITMKVASRLQFNRRLWTYGIQVETAAGIVTLRGTVETQAEYDLAQKLAADVSGVLGVNNELKIGP